LFLFLDDETVQLAEVYILVQILTPFRCICQI